jgi:glucan phosphoethanolaminetransferase (alkaline phosphatase superfamily)
MELQTITNESKELFYLFIFVIFVSYYVLILLILTRYICFFIFKNKPSFFNFSLYMFCLAIGTYFLTRFMEKMYPNKDIVKTAYIFEGTIISIYSVFVNDAHLKMFVLSFLDFWNKINKWDKLNKIKYQSQDLKRLMKKYKNRNKKI